MKKPHLRGAWLVETEASSLEGACVLGPCERASWALLFLATLFASTPYFCTPGCGLRGLLMFALLVPSGGRALLTWTTMDFCYSATTGGPADGLLDHPTSRSGRVLLLSAMPFALDWIKP